MLSSGLIALDKELNLITVVCMAYWRLKNAASDLSGWGLFVSNSNSFGKALYSALRDRKPIGPLSEQDSTLTVDDAYSFEFLALRQKDGERVIGKKIGVTSKAVQDMLGVHQPDFGFLTDWMLVDGDIDLDGKALIAPRAEVEIAFIVKDRLNGPGDGGATPLIPKTLLRKLLL